MFSTRALTPQVIRPCDSYLLSVYIYTYIYIYLYSVYMHMSVQYCIALFTFSLHCM